MGNKEIKSGVIQAGFSYLLWGLLPIYWKLLGHVNAIEILANRVFWSFVFMLALLVFSGKFGAFLGVLKEFKAQRKQIYALSIASVLISGNWGVYIWAVNTGQMVEASMGYYINPLVSVLLGMIVLKEKLTKAQYVSFALAFIGVIIISLSYGRFPWIALTLAFTFGFYGLAKKLIKVDSSIGLTLETMAVTPIALAYLILMLIKGTSAYLHTDIGTHLLLAGAGVVTALPLLFFANGAQKIPLSMLGFLQYIAPTLSLMLGIFVYGEQFSGLQLLAFIFIWSALTLYSLSKTRLFAAVGVRMRNH
ncbi:EamA family transporter RarD [Neobacillus notoginsengisoli]|uniref:EamA family transporter RarD n=1 Tax=Neobacillus notoginsengisoli TaxID=1578198 RepID=A0A417YU97_9BACI|nr:EamA family transporter RarD [Neobacillus notoginsengisoli]RHW40756.1 EamA family transporter RarD [Neobacillus notoginsengisoli]